MSDWKRVVGVGELFDGLDVKVDPEAEFVSAFGRSLCEVIAVRSATNLMGKFNVAVTPGTLWISPDNLKSVPADEPVEFSTDNPYGKFTGTVSRTRGASVVIMACYEKGVAVSVSINGGTIYSRSFFDVDQSKIASIVGWEDDWPYSDQEWANDLIRRLENVKA